MTRRLGLTIHAEGRDQLPASGRLHWLGALSFEERCLGSITLLKRWGYRFAEATLVEYPTEIRPKEGERARSMHRRRLQRDLGSCLGPCRTHPYRYIEFLRILAGIADGLREDPKGHLVIDITCMTKLHVMAVAYFLLTEGMSCDVSLAYSIPKLYGSPVRNIWGQGRWSGVVQARLDLDSTHQHQRTFAVGLLGHEGDRLRLGLHEANPEELLLLRMVQAKNRSSNVEAMVDIQNARLLRELESSTRIQTAKRDIDLMRPSQLFSAVGSVCESARTAGARVVLCPFGPKPSVFYATYAALERYREAIWASYPTPTVYDADYSHGLVETLWFTHAASRNQLGLFAPAPVGFLSEADV